MRQQVRLESIASEHLQLDSSKVDENTSNVLLRMIYNSLAIKKGRKPAITFGAVGKYAESVMIFTQYFEPHIIHPRRKEIIPFLDDAYSTVFEYVINNHSTERLSRARIFWKGNYSETVH